MKDPLFIQEMVARGKEAREKVKAEFDQLTLAQLNWKPAEESWSIGQCLDHLIISDCSYFPIFKKIAAGKFSMSSWEILSPFSGMFGRLLAGQINETPRKKLRSPKVFAPVESKIDAVILERYYKHLDSLLEYTASFSKVNIDRVRITSPALRFVTYSLRRAIIMLIQHEHRHINQAIRVKQEKDFPVQ